MKCILALLLVFSYNAIALAQSKPLAAQLNKHKAPRYVMKYYFEDTPDITLWNRVVSRLTTDSGKFYMLDYDAKNPDHLLSSSFYDEVGMPIVTENAKDFMKVFPDRIRLSFMGKDTTVFMNGTALRNSTLLWFWKYQPKKGEEVVVGGIRRNFMTKKIDHVQVSYVYLGKERIQVMGKSGRYHVLRSRQLNGDPTVYDDVWYDKKGMMVKEKHVVGKKPPRFGVLTKIIE